jgi:hypothetical protein
MMATFGACWRRHLMVCKPSHPGHENIDDHGIERISFDGFHSALAAFGDHDTMTLVLQDQTNGIADGDIIVDDKDMCHGGFLS